MRSRIVPIILVLLLLIVQWQLWTGRGSVAQRGATAGEADPAEGGQRARSTANERLANEVNDLKEGLEMVEERARRSWAWSSPTRSSCRSRSGLACA